MTKNYFLVERDYSCNWCCSIYDCWKETMIAPIPKSTSKSSDPGNYRLISLTCIFCKLLEKHIRFYGLMYEHLSNYHLLSDSQWGGCSGCSTVTALLSVTEEWLCPWIWPRSMCCVLWLSERLWQCPALASAEEILASVTTYCTGSVDI